jgi:hypothetical protein
LLCWVLELLPTEEEPLLVLLELDVPVLDVPVPVPDVPVPDVPVPDVPVPDELLAFELPAELSEVEVPEEGVLAACVECAAWSTRMPNPARLAATTPPTATLMREESGLRGRPVLFMPLRCSFDFS